MISAVIMSFILIPLLMAIICVIVMALGIGALGISKTPSKRGKIGVLLSIVVFAGCCTAAIIFLIKSNKAELNDALRQAVLSGNTTRAEELVAKGADINEADRDGYTLLRNSIERRDLHTFKTLVEVGADVKTGWAGRYGDKNQTPLQLVLERSYYSEREGFDYPAVKLLIEHGAEFDFEDKIYQGKTCLQNTIEKRQIEILKLMLDNGADVNIQNDWGGVLHWAGSMPIIELLLTHHPDVNVKDKQGYTPLHKAVLGKNKEIVLILLENGADISIKNNYNMTPLELAKSMQKSPRLGISQDIVDLLEKRQ